MNDSPLVTRLKQRDPSAFAEVFEAYSDRIYHLALSLIHDEQIADGVVQNTFMALIESIDAFEGRASIGTWLYRVAYNEVMGRLRRNGKHPQMEFSEAEDEDACLPEALIDWQTLPEKLLTSAEIQQEIESALQMLKPGLRSVFILRDVEEFSTEETATILNITPGSVKVRLHRARLILREALSSYFEEVRHGM